MNEYSLSLHIVYSYTDCSCSRCSLLHVHSTRDVMSILRDVMFVDLMSMCLLLQHTPHKHIVHSVEIFDNFLCLILKSKC